MNTAGELVGGCFMVIGASFTAALAFGFASVVIPAWWARRKDRRAVARILAHIAKCRGTEP